MKRPRRPTKKTARKAVRKKAKVVRKRTPRTFFSKSDPFYLDAKLIPAGWAYQWSTYVDPRTGWRPVPYSRHAHDFPKIAQSDDGFIVISGLTLAEIPAEHVAAELTRGAQAARDLTAGFDRSIGREGGGKGFWVMPESWIASYGRGEELREMAPLEGPPIEVAVTLVIKVPSRWDSAAAYLKLGLPEYARRRILMERPLLGCTQRWNGSRDAEPLYEPFLLNLAPREA